MSSRPRPVGRQQARLWNFGASGLEGHFWPIREWPWAYQRSFIKSRLDHVERFNLYHFLWANGLNHSRCYWAITYGRNYSKQTLDKIYDYRKQKDLDKYSHWDMQYGKTLPGK